ncbi:MAG: RidA family protein [Aquabacterium sp.]
MTRTLISSGSKWEDMAGYSRAVVDGSWIFVSGTVGANADGSFARTAKAQAERAFEIIESALQQARSSLDDVVRVHVYLASARDLGPVAAVLKARLGQARPANTTVCTPLVVPGAKVEIEVTARRQRKAAKAPGKPAK